MGLRKKVKHQGWIDIDCVVQKRKRMGIESDVCIDETLIPPNKLREKATRNAIDVVTRSQQEPRTPELPNRVSIWTPQPCQLLAPLIQQLPWARFSASLEAQPYNALSNLQHQSSSAGGHHDQTTNQSLPFPSTSSGQDFGGLTKHNANIQLLLLLAFTLSNNLMTNSGIAKLLELVPPPSRFSHLRDLVWHEGATTEAVAENLFRYAKLHDTQMLSMLLGLGIDPNEQVVSWLGILTTPLAYAAYFNKVESVKVLILAGADVNGAHSVIKDGESPLEKAVASFDCEITLLLLNHGAKVDGSYRPRTGASMLKCAFQDHKAPGPFLIKALLDNGASMELDGQQGAEILALALPDCLDTNDDSCKKRSITYFKQG
ncbi:uncharacterized protein A1O9_07774 [Exophiala aquamarina CBS 119918]|uniref:Uncharacterized protein n=1 Tax=Exophiala aquamarina CBS 119918 TaxID=1182545 RepID=A0A072PA99_9EURO|nr:uncharacterized protein A1O9_07774 [Exophiala aquamarina CBS 119918]KEF56193.1 hypothetical protein A1O9_07774 [Exophiala aquamarina CBS 119918]